MRVSPHSRLHETLNANHARRGGAGPRGVLPTLSQYMLSSAATFGFFLSIGSVRVLCCCPTSREEAESDGSGHSERRSTPAALGGGSITPCVAAHAFKDGGRETHAGPVGHGAETKSVVKQLLISLSLVSALIFLPISFRLPKSPPCSLFSGSTLAFALTNLTTRCNVRQIFTAASLAMNHVATTMRTLYKHTLHICCACLRTPQNWPA